MGLLVFDEPGVALGLLSGDAPCCGVPLGELVPGSVLPLGGGSVVSRLAPGVVAPGVMAPDGVDPGVVPWSVAEPDLLPSVL